MSLTEGAIRDAVCTNAAADCAKAASGETLEWYPGAGEYCPECGEALSVLPAAPPPSLAAEPERVDDGGPAPADSKRTRAVDVAGAAGRPPRSALFASPVRWLWLVAGVLIASAVGLYIGRRLAVDRVAGNAVAVCPVPSAQQLATDLVRAYASKSAAPPGDFVVSTTGTCDVRFSTAPAPPEAVIARDGIVAIVNPLNPISRISETQLRALFSGRIRDWSELGGPRGAIVPVLPDPASDEAKILASSLFYGVTIDPDVRRAGGSADVTRAVTGADSASRRAIGIVTFSQSVAAKVVPLSYLPAPNVLSIASGRYPYTLSIAVEAGATPNASETSAAAQGLVDYARSRDGAAIVLKNGLIPREGF